MKTTKIIATLLATALLTGCNSSSKREPNSESTLSAEAEPLSSKQSTIDFAGKTRNDFNHANDMYTFYRGSDCAVFKDREFESDKFVISSYDGNSRTLATLYEINPSLGSTEIAVIILKTFYEVVDTSERSSLYHNLYFDWATYGGQPVAFWTLTRGIDDNFHQTADIVWYDKHVEEAFNVLMER